MDINQQTDSQLHVVLGASGPSGQAVVRALQERHLKIRAVERSKNVPGIDTFRADLLDAEQAKQATQGATHVYVCIGLPYDANIWRRDWPMIMKNIIDACAQNGATIIFLDNVYMYGPAPLAAPFDESHPQHPPSVKGGIRKQIAEMLLNAISEGKVKGVIGRSADFYGPGATTSLLYVPILKRMLEKKGPIWLGSSRATHTYAYTPDIGRALVALALDESTYGHVWHLPVGEPIMVGAFVNLLNAQLGTEYSVRYIPRFVQNLISLGSPLIREAAEMAYQFRDDYIMDDQKFMQHFPDFTKTPYETGAEAMVVSFRDKQ